MQLFGSINNKINKDKNLENVPYLEITEVVSFHCNIANKEYQQNSRVFYTLMPNESFGQLLDVSPQNVIV